MDPGAVPPSDGVLWRPTESSMAATRLGAFAHWVAEQRGNAFGEPMDYDRIWRWSVESPQEFWGDLATWTGALPGVPDAEVLADSSMPGATWFPGRTLNYAEQALRPAVDGRVDPGSPALIAVSEDSEPVEVSWQLLRGQVGALAATLRRLGVRPGDRVVGYLPNIPEAAVALLATAAVGAVWSVCAPDFGARAVLDRFTQIEPVVLIAVDGYRFNGRAHDRCAAVGELRAALPTVRATIHVPRLNQNELPEDALAWDDAVADLQEPVFEALAFDAPCGSCTPRARPACPRASSTATAASCWSS